MTSTIPPISKLINTSGGTWAEIDIYFGCNGCGKTTSAAWCIKETSEHDRLYRCPRCNWILLEIVRAQSERGSEYSIDTQIDGFRLIPDARIYRQTPRSERRAAFLESDPWDLSQSRRGGPGLSIDLQAFERQIRDDPRFTILSGLIRSLGSRGSIAEDLRLSQHLCQAAQSFDIGHTLTGSGSIAEPEYLAASGMINYAIIMYYRATEHNPTNAKRFSPMNIRKLLSNELKVWHDRILEIRSRAIAHYGDPIDGDYQWHKDATVMYIDNDVFSLRYPPIRTGYLGQVTDKLEELCQIGLELVKKDLRDKEKKFNFELHEALMIYPEIETILHGCKFDADVYFGIPEAGQRFRDLEAGKVKAIDIMTTRLPRKDRY